MKLFDKYQVIGLSDLHGCAELLAFVEQLAQAPEFAAKVNDIRWEPGNARHQGLMDEFVVRGKDIPFRELAQCWRNNTQTHTWWGEFAPPPSGDIFFGADGKRVQPRSDRKIQDRWDAVVYLGKRRELTRVDPPGPEILDAEWMTELKRRKGLRGGPLRGLELKERPHSRQFFSDDGPVGDQMIRLPLGKDAPGLPNSLQRRKP